MGDRLRRNGHPEAAQSAIIWHEFAHGVGILGPDSGPGIKPDASQANSRRIRDACF